jgi:hyperosmotically inducible protein
LTVVATAVLAIGTLMGCQRQASSDSVNSKMDRSAERAEQKMDQAGNDVKQQAQRAGDTAKDAAITTKVKAVMIAKPGLKSLQINVDTVNGVVTLSGTVDSQQNLDRAQQIAQGVEGVTSVENRLTVKGG